MIVFITGASSGLGEALARHYAAQGAVLGLFARRRDELERMARELPSNAIAIYDGDVRDAGALSGAGTDFMQRHGVPDVVVANAGISRGTLTQQRTYGPWAIAARGASRRIRRAGGTSGTPA